jgi:hypothetical protein
VVAGSCRNCWCAYSRRLRSKIFTSTRVEGVDRDKLRSIDRLSDYLSGGGGGGDCGERMQRFCEKLTTMRNAKSISIGVDSNEEKKGKESDANIEEKMFYPAVSHLHVRRPKCFNILYSRICAICSGRTVHNSCGACLLPS